MRESARTTNPLVHRYIRDTLDAGVEAGLVEFVLAVTYTRTWMGLARHETRRAALAWATVGGTSGYRARDKNSLSAHTRLPFLAVAYSQ